MISNQINRVANTRVTLDPSLVGDLWFFEVAARLQGFSAAARELHVTQGAVSQRIRHLEQRLGFKVFERFGRRVTLTMEGESLFSLAGRFFRPRPRAAGLWWIIADFQPDPILDPSVPLDVGRSLFVPSLRTVDEEILSEKRRREVQSG